MKKYVNKKSIFGSIVALVTPMHSNGQIDYQSLLKLINWHIKSGTNGFLIAGTTGEFCTLSDKEWLEIIEFVSDNVPSNYPVIVGLSGSCTSSVKKRIELIENNLQIDAILVSSPHYNKPSQEGLYEHFFQISQSTDKSIIIYNVPSRTGCDIFNETILRLIAKSEKIIGIKDATGDIIRGIELIYTAPKRFSVFSGDDLSAPILMNFGAIGIMSVTANIFPREISHLCQEAMLGNITYTKNFMSNFNKINSLIFCESNPIPVKWILSKMRKIHEEYRLPLTKLSEKFHKDIIAALQEHNIFIRM